MDEPVSDDAAHQRWIVIQLLRVAGIALVILGITMARGVVDLAGDANRLTGYCFIVVGLLDAFVMPQYLARKWRSPRE